MAAQAAWGTLIQRLRLIRVAERAKRLKENEFYEGTSVEGFGFINKAKTNKEVIFWYIVVIVFASLTVFNVTKSTMNYLSDPTLTIVKLSTAQNDPLPNFYIIYGVTPMEFASWKEIERETDDGFVRFNNEVLSKQNNLSIYGNSTELLNFWYNEKANCSIDCDGWLENVGFVPQNDELLLYILFRLYFLQTAPEDYDKVQVELPTLEETVNVKAFIEASANLGLIMADIIEKVSEQLIELLGIFVYSGWKGQWNSTVNGTAILQGIRLMGLQHFMRIELLFYPEFPRNSTNKNIDCFSRLPKIYDLVSMDENETDFSPFTDYYQNAFYFYFKDAIVGFQWKSIVPLTKPFDVFTYSYVLTGKRITLTNKGCIPGTRPKWCMKQCVSKMLMKACDCLPWESYAAFEKPQSLLCDAHDDCATKGTTKQAMSDCAMNQCNDTNYCETSIYRIDNIKSSLFKMDYPMGYVGANIKQEAIYPVYELHYAMTPFEYVADLGGQMSAWMGITFIALLHGIVMVVKHFNEWRNRGKVGDQDKSADEVVETSSEKHSTIITVE